MNLNLYTSTYCSLPLYKKRGNEKGNEGKVKIYPNLCPYLYFMHKVRSLYIYFNELIHHYLPYLMWHIRYCRDFKYIKER
jgi:hypothetical protein